MVHLEAKDLTENLYSLASDLLQIHGMPEEALKRRYATSVQTTGHDPLKETQIRVHVESETVRGDPARDVNSNGYQFGVSHPHPSCAGKASGLDPVFLGHADENFFERAHVPADITAMLSEVDNRVADQLTGAVIGDVTAAVGLKNAGSPCTQER